MKTIFGELSPNLAIVYRKRFMPQLSFSVPKVWGPMFPTVRPVDSDSVVNDHKYPDSSDFQAFEWHYQEEDVILIWFKTSSFHQSDFIPSLSKVFNFVYDQSQSDNFFEPGVLTNSRVLSVQNLEYWAKKKSTILLERFFLLVFAESWVLTHVSY